MAHVPLSSTDPVVHAREAARSANWHEFNRCLQQLLRHHGSEGSSYKGASSSRGGSVFAVSSSSQQCPSSMDVLDLVLYALPMGDFQVRWDVAKLIPTFGAAAIAPLTTLLGDAQEDEDWELIWFITRSLGEIRHPDAIATLAHLLRTSDHEDIAQAAIGALAQIGEPALPTLTALMEDATTRWAAVQSLAQIHHPAAAAVLMQAIHDDSPEVRVVAIAALSYMHRAQAIPLLIEALSDPSAQIRCAAIVGLGLQTEHLDIPHVLQAAAPLLWDINSDVRRQTAYTLSRFRTEAAAEKLYQALMSSQTPEFLKLDLVRALLWMAIPEALHWIQQALEFPAAGADGNSENSGLSPQIYRDIATALGLLHEVSLKPMAAELLMQILQLVQQRQIPESLAIEVKQAIAFSLGQLNQPDTIDCLTQLAADPNAGIRLHAMAALKKMAIAP